ncbi:MAG: hypothetical protein HFF29_01570 [Oscillospiraceae bacterium]|nr:hypothetical protein [Oscillospiraceae bacterium]
MKRYRISEFSEWEVTARRLHGVGRARFELFQNGEAQYELKQPHLLLPYLVKFPLFMFFLESPFYFYRSGVKCGRWRTLRNPTLRPGMWEFYFENTCYRLDVGPYSGFRKMVKNDPWIPQSTLYQDEEKVAVYTKGWRENGHLARVHYAVEYKEKMGARPDILLLFGIFAEHYLNWDR